jgi:hypothetical protein
VVVSGVVQVARGWRGIRRRGWDCEGTLAMVDAVVVQVRSLWRECKSCVVSGEQGDEITRDFGRGGLRRCPGRAWSAGNKETRVGLRRDFGRGGLRRRPGPGYLASISMEASRCPSAAVVQVQATSPPLAWRRVEAVAGRSRRWVLVIVVALVLSPCPCSYLSTPIGTASFVLTCHPRIRLHLPPSLRACSVVHAQSCMLSRACSVVHAQSCMLSYMCSVAFVCVRV